MGMSYVLQNPTLLTYLPENTYFKRTKERKDGPKSSGIDLWLLRVLWLGPRDCL